MGRDEMTVAEAVQAELMLFDTHTLVWYVEGSQRIGATTREAMRLGSPDDRVLVSAITPWEIALLVSKKRLLLSSDVMDWVNEVLAKPGISLVPLEPKIAIASTRLPFDMHPDPADRILVATARRFGATLVTADRALLDLAAQGYFKVRDATQ
jgi:PIN domain nuclease of toxin-antitoxin system